MVQRLDLSHREASEADLMTVSIVVRDARGFTHHYEDFTSNAENTQRALQILAEGHARPEQKPMARPKLAPSLGTRTRMTHRAK